jgi:hypothetical protein
MAEELLDENTELWYLGGLAEFVKVSDEILLFLFRVLENFRFSFKQFVYLLNK